MSFQQVLSSFAYCMVSLPPCRIANARNWSAERLDIFWPGESSTMQSPWPCVERRSDWSYSVFCLAFSFWNFASVSISTPLILGGPACATSRLQLVPSADVESGPDRVQQLLDLLDRWAAGAAA